MSETSRNESAPRRRGALTPSTVVAALAMLVVLSSFAWAKRDGSAVAKSDPVKCKLVKQETKAKKGSASPAAKRKQGNRDRVRYAYECKVRKGKIKGKHIRAEAIRTKHLRDGAVTGEKLADNAITSSKLAPDAVDTRALAPDAIGPEQVQDVASKPLEVLPGWSASPDLPPRYAVDAQGVVHLSGLIHRGENAAAAGFRLPAEARPFRDREVPAAAGGCGVGGGSGSDIVNLYIHGGEHSLYPGEGSFAPANCPTGGYYYLDGISFVPQT